MPKNQSYGPKVRDRAEALLGAIHNFANQSMDDAQWETLYRQGMRAKKHPEKKIIDFQATNHLLQDLTELKRGKGAEVREALNLLEKFVKCLQRFRTGEGAGQGVAKIYGRITLWSKDVETNLLYFKAAWDEQRVGRGLPRLEPNLSIPNPALLNPPSETQPSPEANPPQNPVETAPQSSPPNPSAAPQSPPQTPQNTRDTSQSEAPPPDPDDDANENPNQNTTTEEDKTFDVDQFIKTLLDNLEHSPAAHLVGQSIGAFFGFEPHAQVKPSDCRTLLQRGKNKWEEYYVNALGPTLSDHELVFIELGTSPVALQQYQNMTWENPQRLHRPRLLGPKTNLVEQFNTIIPQRRLLILGAPGAGKTIALIEIMRFLFEQAEHDDKQPIPVLFQLSTYGHPPTGRNFKEWLVNRLALDYGVAKPRGRQFLNQQKLLLLLDGLDELRPQLRNVCIEKINEFLRRQSQTECVVTSRRTEYDEIQESLHLDAAIELQPLDVEQAVNYLERLPQAAQLRPLIGAIQTRPDFQKLAETPLLLNVMAIAYQDVTVEDLQLFNSIDDHRRYLFDVLISRLLNRQQTVNGQKTPSPSLSSYPYSQQEIIDWLIWLARHMVDHGQTVFYIEQLQPTWLDKRKQIEGYRQNSIALVGIAGGTSSACHMGANANWSLAIETLNNFVPILGIGISAGITICLVFNAMQKKFPKWLSAMIAASLYITLFGVLAYDNINQSPERNYISELSPIFLNWVVFVVFLGWIPEEIALVPKAQWSWRSALRYASIGLSILLLLYVPVRLLIASYGSSGLRRFFWEVVTTVMLSAIVGGLAVGRPPDIKTTTKPNQGIWIAGTNTLLFLGAIGVTGMVIAHYYSDNLAEYPMIALAIGIVAALLGGRRSGFVLIQHFVLRFLLWRNGYAPWNYQRFLNFAVKRMFLNRAGGGYLFMHRSFMEHLSAKYSE